MLSSYSPIIFILLFVVVRLILPVLLLYTFGKMIERYKSEVVM